MIKKNWGKIQGQHKISFKNSSFVGHNFLYLQFFRVFIYFLDSLFRNIYVFVYLFNNGTR